MSDIVEMLVDAAGGNETHVCAIAAAEIKRNLSQIEQLDARCGRLRDTCSTWERASNNYAEAVEIKDAEIDRLRGENLARGNALSRIAVALFGDQNNRTDEECVAAAAEVGYGLAGCREKVARQAEEIERLRGENNVLASLLECWLNPMLRKDGQWSISGETLEQLVDATKKTLETRR